MEQKSLTALISAFSRAYHALNNEVTIFNDSLARDLLTDEEFNQIAKNMFFQSIICWRTRTGIKMGC